MEAGGDGAVWAVRLPTGTVGACAGAGCDGREDSRRSAMRCWAGGGELREMARTAAGRGVALRRSKDADFDERWDGVMERCGGVTRR